MEFANSSSTTTMSGAASMTRPWKYRDKLWFKIGIWVSVLLVLAASVRGVHFANATSIERTIDQNLGPESDEASVRAFMAAHRIQFIGCIPELRRCDGKMYRASISLLFKSYILIEFNFGENGKLVSHKVHELYQVVWDGLLSIAIESQGSTRSKVVSETGLQLLTASNRTEFQF